MSVFGTVTSDFKLTHNARPPALAALPCRFISGETLVVDGAAWLHRPQLVPRNMVSQVSRGVEGKSRKIGTAADSVRSKL